MTAQQCIDKFHNYVSDELDSDFELQLVNDAKNAIETELQLEITKKLDLTGSVSAGQTSTTARSLPADFLSPLTIYVGTDPVMPVPFEQQQFYKDLPQRYWIDLASNQYHLTGSQGSANTIYFYYQYETPVLTVNDSPVWPERFHSLIPLEMAKLYWQIDQGEKNRAWTTEYAIEHMRWKRLFQDWDHKLKLNAIDNSAFSDTTAIPSENRINL